MTYKTSERIVEYVQYLYLFVKLSAQSNINKLI